MDVYEGLSEEQCLYVGYSHNEIHEKSRKMNFQEKVAFFHQLLEKKKMSMHNKSPKVIAVSWRADISTFTRKTQTSLKQPRNETDGDETKNQKQKKMKSTCMDLEGDNEEVPSRKVILKQNRSNEEHSKMQRECEEGKGSEGTEQELAIVEYNHQTFYLGILSDENTFIFCKEPIAKVQKEKFTYNISKMSIKIDRKDKQIIDTGYLVCKFLGHVTKDTISMKAINKENLDTQIRNYLK